MTTRTRTAAVALVTAALFGACSSGSKKAPTAAPSSATTPPPSAAPPSTTTTLPVFGADGAFMTAPAQPTTKPYDPDPQCQSLIDAGFTGTCQQASTKTGTFAVLSEQQRQQSGGPGHGGATGESRELLYHRDGDHWSLALRYSGQISENAQIIDTSQLSDVAADGDEKGVFALHTSGQNGDSSVQALDVAEATGKVVLHLTLDHGVARTATGGGLETWSRINGTSPLQFRHLVIRYHDGAWRAELDQPVPAEQVPRPDAKSSDVFY